MEIVEAAHIWPYRGEDDNHPENGLLLRADLHTLYDLDLLAVHPEDLTVRVHPSAKTAGYAQFEGQRLRLRGRSIPSAHAMGTRWASFLERLDEPVKC